MAGAPHGTVVTAERADGGPRAPGPHLVGPAGRALLLSLVIREPDPLLPLRAGLAVADVRARGARVKWPNDVLLDGRKVAGILIEARPQEGWAIVGIGINAPPDSSVLPRGGAGGCRDARPDRSALLQAALTELLSALDTAGAEPPRRRSTALRARDALLGSPLCGRAAKGRGRDRQTAPAVRGAAAR